MCVPQREPDGGMKNGGAKPVETVLTRIRVANLPVVKATSTGLRVGCHFIERDALAVILREIRNSRELHDMVYE